MRNNDFILICFQEKFEDIHLNIAIKSKSKISDEFNIKILKNKFYTGNMIDKHNHYFFIGKKL